MRKAGAGTTAKHYYRAFHLVIGAPYENELWDVTLGALHLEQLGAAKYGKLAASPHRRRTGRPKGHRRCAPGEVKCGILLRACSPDPSERMQQQELVEQLQEFLRRTQQGIPVLVAAAELSLEPIVVEQLLGPGGLARLREFLEAGPGSKGEAPG
jgi:hypothetical protein